MGLRIVKDNSMDYFARIRSLRAVQIEQELKRWAAVTDRGSPLSLIEKLNHSMPENSKLEELTMRLRHTISRDRPRMEFVQGNLSLENIPKLLED